MEQLFLRDNETQQRLLKAGDVGRVQAVVRAVAVNGDMPVTIRIKPKGKKWKVHTVKGWKPKYNQSCVDKIDGMLTRMGRFMENKPSKTLYLHLEGDFGTRGTNYYLEYA